MHVFRACRDNICEGKGTLASRPARLCRSAFYTARLEICEIIMIIATNARPYHAILPGSWVH